MEIIVRIADMKMSKEEDDVLVTYGLGSCLGMTVYDPEIKVGGMIHLLLPNSQKSSSTIMRNAFAFVDTGIPLLLKLAELAGAEESRLQICIAGGASFRKDARGIFAVGQRNLSALHEIVQARKLEIKGMEIGGHVARTMSLEIRTGIVKVSTAGKAREL